MAEMYSDSRTVLNSFEVALQIYKDIRSSLTVDDYRKVYDAYDTIATFADKEYQQVSVPIYKKYIKFKIAAHVNCHK